MGKGFSLAELADLFDETIDDMLSDGWAEVSTQDAVELFEIVTAVNLARHNSGRELVLLPRSVARQVLDCAKRGLHKGKGRQRPRDSYLNKLLKETAVQIARDRKAELMASGNLSASSAQRMAAEEVCKLLADHYNNLDWSENTIEGRMTRSDF